MTYINDSDILRNMQFFTKAFPIETIQEKNIHTQLGVHFEEIGEMVTALVKCAKDQKTAFVLNMLAQALLANEKTFKGATNLLDVKPEMREEILDAICDQIVTSSGFGYMLKMDVAGAFGEVNRSNFSKFDKDGNPIYNDDLKMIKGPDYFKPNLKQYI